MVILLFIVKSININKFLLKVSHQLLCQNETKDSSTPDVEKRCYLCMTCIAGQY